MERCEACTCQEMFLCYFKDSLLPKAEMNLLAADVSVLVQKLEEQQRKKEDRKEKKRSFVR